MYLMGDGIYIYIYIYIYIWECPFNFFSILLYVFFPVTDEKKKVQLLPQVQPEAPDARDPSGPGPGWPWPLPAAPSPARLPGAGRGRRDPRPATAGRLHTGPACRPQPAAQQAPFLGSF